MMKIRVGISNIIYSDESLFIYDVSAKVFIKIMKFVRDYIFECLYNEICKSLHI